MTLRNSLRAQLAPALKERYPAVWNGLKAADVQLDRARTAVARHLPVVVRPQARQLQIAVTAYCNQRCIGCRYGRDFMPNSQLAWPVVRRLLDDAKELGFSEIRLYGGEPLLHRDLPRMVERTVALGMEPFVTTNAVLLAEKIDDLYAAGLRTLTVGFYGTGDRYDAYVQRRDRFRLVEQGIAAVRERYGDSVDMRINWLLMRPTCDLDDLEAACAFAERYRLRIQVDLVHYSLPYFSEGPDRVLQFRPEDRPAVEMVVADLVRRKRERPELFNQSLLGLRSIPDWLLLGPAMRVPCDAGRMIWVGADGSVQLCYVTFGLGNLHETRLRDMLFTPPHVQAARDAMAVNCPNCHCRYDRRIDQHGPSARHYGNLLAAEPG
jgi:molybdenum cofactor biosynthesis enzyme MoaA